MREDMMKQVNEEEYVKFLSGASKPRQIICVFGFLLIGFTVGLTCGIRPLQIHTIAEGEDVVRMTEGQISWLASTGIVSCVPGHVIGGFVASIWGRRIGGMLVCPLYISGLFMCWVGSSTLIIFIGRVILGLTNGIQHASCTSYYTETTSPHIRTGIHALGGVFVCTGILVPSLFAELGVSWRTFCLWANTIPALAIIYLFFTPESAAWLVSKGRLKEARKSLILLRGPYYDYEEEIQYLLRSYAFLSDGHKKMSQNLTRLKDPDVWKPFIIVLMTFCFQILCGLATVDIYVINIMKASGSTIGGYTSANMVGYLRVAGQIMGAILLVRYPRKPLFFISSLFTGLAACGMGFSCLYNPNKSQLFQSAESFNSSKDIINQTMNATQMIDSSETVYEFMDYIPLICISLMPFFFCLALGPVPWAYGNELFPLDVRSQLCGITTALFNVQQSLVVKIFPKLTMAIGLGGVFLVYAGMAVCCALWAAFVLPETKGKTTHEISRMFYSDKQLKRKRLHSEGYAVCPD